MKSILTPSPEQSPRVLDNNTFMGTVRTVVSGFKLKRECSPTAEQRSRDRYRRIALTTFTAASSKAVLLLTMIISVPLTIHYLGTERYALWMVISSSVAMLTFSDLGIGNGLLNAIAESHGEGDERAARHYVSSAFFMLLGIASSIVLLLAASYYLVPWARIFGVTSGIAAGDAGPASAVFIVCFAASLPLGIVQRVESGYQNGFVYDLWNALGSILGLGGLLLAVKLRAGLPWLVLSVSGAPLVASLLNGTVLFTFQCPALRPRWSESNRRHMKQLLNYGIYFFVLQICIVATTAGDNLIISHLLGANAVTTYAVTMRMFMVVPNLLLMVLLPLWPAYGESIARGEISWARRALGRSLKLIFAITSLAGVVLVLAGPWILHKWVGNSFDASRTLLIGMALWMCLSTAGNAVSVFLNGANRLQVQIVSGLGLCVMSLVLKLVLVPHLGLSSIMWSTDLAYVLFVWIPVVLFLPRLLSSMRPRTNSVEMSGSGGSDVLERSVGTETR